MFALIQNNLPIMLWGAGMTILVSGVAIILGMPLGLVLCFGVTSKKTWLRYFSRIYQSVWRGTPILVQLLIIYYLLPLIGINVAPILAAILALTLNTIAFQAEIFRGGLLAIPPGQLEAARMVGIRKWAGRQHILVPQILRLVIPSLVNETISILKNSSLVSVIAVTELMRVSQQIVATTYRPFEIYITAAVIYIVINFLLSLIGRMAEQRLAQRA
ncbi:MULTISPECIES: amino acid ABC transporter permease [unclassified Mesorhizobium]|uniref:amino acid ABC transporter permease n=1 Tax=unclassified Mesorhizobium TaxID=325217 RepID=UPI00112ED0A1|nr:MULTISPECIES: amino acid ABC transporter permease [unclassified Mesorhizobium]MCA0023991.1 amino acid ABC transporter permease [Mesorhizobium sp. B263B1A]TPJ94550.1 amino acid ABC transporter permease [Mesorhizobium sp. B2-5-12]TPK23249.1 amino acid ABC transporter permease [Mesorhizobium sp. B2-5-6]TPN39012.1 amino acid ABC transporter permease [Mesorhizobium sp. B1-1-6]